MERGADRRLEDLRLYNRKLSRLCRLTSEIARLGDERETLQKVVDTAASLLTVQGAHLALVDKKEEALFGVVSSGRHPQNAPRLKLQLSHAYAAQEAIKTCRPVAIDRAEDDVRVNPRARELMGIRGIAYLPLLSGEQCFGLLILVTRRPHVWTAEDLDLAANFASLASVALENTRLMSRLAETESRLRNIVEHIPAIVYVCDVNPPYRAQYLSPQVETILGIPANRWIGDAESVFMKILHPDDASRVASATRRDQKKGFSSLEYRLMDQQGEVRWFRDEAVLVRDPAGDPVAWHGVLVEITGLKRMQQH
ncbi:MAG: GAF domain-containing protein [Candidatus Polarisedimenticolia bacterium]